jgi:hypothetical protein
MTREALRQQMLVRALWRDDAVLQGWARAPARASTAQGLAAYRANAGALAERALRSAYPTIAALVGDESFAALARHFWHRHPPQDGDVGTWGEALPAFIADSLQLADEPYLADSARLDWALHRASRAADAANGHDLESGLAALAQADLSTVHLQLAPGAAVLASRFPIVSIWQAHQGRLSFDAVRAAFEAARAEHAFVWRDTGFALHVDALSPADAAFTRALLERRSLAIALDAAGADFAFDRWLVRALGARWLVALSFASSTP